MAQSPLIKFEDYFGIPAISFRSVGLNPYFDYKERTSTVRKCLNFVLFHFCFWLLVVSTILELVFCCTVFSEEGRLMDFCRAMSCALFDTMAIEEFLLIWWSGHRFTDFILQLEQMFPVDRETQDKYAIAKQAGDTQKLLKSFATIYTVCIFIWVVGTPLMDILLCNFQGTVYVFELPFKMWSPWDLNQTVPFYIALLMQFDTIYASVIMTLALNTFFVSIMAHIGLQFDMLSQNIRDLQPNDGQGLLKIIHLHIRLIEVGRHFSQLLSRTVFFNHLLSSVSICCALFQVLTSDIGEIFRFIFVLIVVLLQTINMSFVGNLLSDYVGQLFYCGLVGLPVFSY